MQSLYSTQLSAQQQPRTQQSAQQLPAGHVGLGTLVLSGMHAAELNTASNRAVSVEEPQQSAAAGDAEQPPAHQHASGSMDLKADVQTEQGIRQQQGTSQAASAEESQKAEVQLLLTQGSSV